MYVVSLLSAFRLDNVGIISKYCYGVTVCRWPSSLVAAVEQTFLTLTVKEYSCYIHVYSL